MFCCILRGNTAALSGYHGIFTVNRIGRKLLDRFRYTDFCNLGAADCLAADRTHVLRNFNNLLPATDAVQNAVSENYRITGAFKKRRLCKCICADMLHMLRHRERLQARTAGKCILANLLYRLRN